MIDAYVWTTPNGFKLLIALEELGVAYTPRWIDIGKGEQKTPAYLAINPNNKIPALVDHTDDGAKVTVFESGACLVYLGDKTGKLLPVAGAPRYTALSWMFFNTGGMAPMTGQLYQFLDKAPDDTFAVTKFRTEVNRLVGVLERRLADSAFLAGDEYSLADVMNITWVKRATELDIGLPGPVQRWHDAVLARPAVQRAYAMKKS